LDAFNKSKSWKLTSQTLLILEENHISSVLGHLRFPRIQPNIKILDLSNHFLPIILNIIVSNPPYWCFVPLDGMWGCSATSRPFAFLNIEVHIDKICTTGPTPCGVLAQKRIQRQIIQDFKWQDPIFDHTRKTSQDYL
jgi:hypothetical protein